MVCFKPLSCLVIFIFFFIHFQCFFLWRFVNDINDISCGLDARVTIQWIFSTFFFLYWIIFSSDSFLTEVFHRWPIQFVVTEFSTHIFIQIAHLLSSYWFLHTACCCYCLRVQLLLCTQSNSLIDSCLKYMHM